MKIRGFGVQVVYSVFIHPQFQKIKAQEGISRKYMHRSESGVNKEALGFATTGWLCQEMRTAAQRWEPSDKDDAQRCSFQSG